MISFIEFLSEQPDREVIAGTDERNLETFASRVVQDCQPLLQQYGLVTLFRGIPGDDKPFLYNREVRKNRRPLNTAEGLQYWIDQWFVENHGHRFRSEAMFVFGDSHLARTYGTVYMVFPIGQFSYAWSPHYMDLWATDNRLARELIDHGYSRHYANMLMHEDDPHDIPKEARRAINQWLDQGEYRTDNLQAAVNSRKEIMIVCDSYHAIRADVAYGSERQQTNQVPPLFDKIKEKINK